MMQIDGKTKYSLEEAAEQTGYTKGTIQNYIYSGTIDGERLDDGTWTVSEAGMIALRRRKKLPDGSHSFPSSTDDVVAPPDPEVARSKPRYKSRVSEGVIYMETDADRKAYDSIKKAAELMGMRVGDMSMVAIRYYAETVLSTTIGELQSLEEKKKKLINGMV
jgi:hypothetical protein